MAIHIAVVSFSGKPDTSDEVLLRYCAFSEEVAGKTIKGPVRVYELNGTEQYGATVYHAVIQDSEIDCKNIILVFENIFVGSELPDDEVMFKMTKVLSKYLLDLYPLSVVNEVADKVTGTYDDVGNIAYVLSDGVKRANELIANSIRNGFKLIPRNEI